MNVSGKIKELIVAFGKYQENPNNTQTAAQQKDLADMFEKVMDINVKICGMQDDIIILRDDFKKTQEHLTKGTISMKEADATFEKIKPIIDTML